MIFVILAGRVRWFLIVCPLNVWLSTRKSDLSFREKMFIAWMAPRGIVAAAITSLTGATMTNMGIEGGVT